MEQRSPAKLAEQMIEGFESRDEYRVRGRYITVTYGFLKTMLVETIEEDRRPDLGQSEQAEQRTCSRCGDGVDVLNSHDQCAGCESELANAAIEADRLLPQLTAQRKAAILYAKANHHVWSWNPNSRYSGPYEPGKFHSRVITWLADNGVIVWQNGNMNGRIMYGGGYALTLVGEVLADWIDR